ncbi:MAG TPA: hypothetical protein VM093_09165 [Aeromicrobium sp.]|nr:hypothetical protein [Aeromicrobium sp.]
MRIRGDADRGLFMPGDGGKVRANKLDVTPWRDPRLIAGVVLVLASTVLGGWVVAALDRTESFWTVGSNVRAGAPVQRDDLVPVRAKVPGATAAGLLRTDRPLPQRLANLRWATDARAGTLVTEADLASRASIVEVPIAVGVGGLPNDLRPGDRIDVWAVAERAADRGEDAAAPAPRGTRRLLTGVRVVSRTSASGITGGPGVTLVVDAAGKTIDATLMSALAAGHITVVRVS